MKQAISVLFVLVALLAIIRLHRTPAEGDPVAFPTGEVKTIKELGISLLLPHEWTIHTNMRGSWTIYDDRGDSTYIVIEPPGYFYDNPVATQLDDYAESYESGGLLIEIVDSHPARLASLTALRQVFNAGDREVDDSLSSALGSVRGGIRYVLPSPRRGEFVILDCLAGKDQCAMLDVLARGITLNEEDW